MNFHKLKGLINEFEKKKEYEQKDFYNRLRSVADQELRLRQEGLKRWF